MSIIKGLVKSHDIKRRPARVGDAILRALACLLRGGTKDPRLLYATFTSVKVTDDLRMARVYFSCSDEELNSVVDGLERAKGFMRSHLAREIALRHVPELIFERDMTMVRMAEIEKLLAEGATDSE